MTLCALHLGGDSTGLCCVREEGHLAGCCYESTSGVAQCAKEEM